MNRISDDQSAAARKADQERRTELAMLGLLIEKYPREAKEKTRKLPGNQKNITRKNKSL